MIKNKESIKEVFARKFGKLIFDIDPNIF